MIDKLVKNFNYVFAIVILNIISFLILIVEILIPEKLNKELSVIVAVICVSTILLSFIYFLVNLLNKFVEFINYLLFKYETQNLKMLVFNMKWDLNPVYDCLSYISKNPKYSKEDLDPLLRGYKNIKNINAFELYQELVRSLCNLSVFELKNMRSFLEIKFNNISLNFFQNKLFISLLLFVLTTFFGVDVQKGIVKFNTSELYKLFKLGDLSFKLFVIYVICAVILFIFTLWIVKRKQRRTILVMSDAIKRALELKESIQKSN